VPDASLAARERAALADLLDKVGPDAPTCCEGWTAAHLAAHVVVRDSRPDAMPGFSVERFPWGARLSRWSHRIEERTRAGTPYPELVSRVRSGPPAWSPVRLAAVDRVLNSSEFVIHHEDVRRAQPGWAPRDLPRSVQDQLWRTVPVLARGKAAPRTPGGLFIRRSDVPDGAPGSERRLRDGRPTTTVTGAPLEVLLWVSGRPDIACVDLTAE
jgi:uncharacterized protein (TIGR03085 family)